MARNTQAPWANLVGDAAYAMTARELAQLPADSRGYELVEGRLVRVSPTGGRHGKCALLVGAALADYVTAQQQGVVLGAESGFVISSPGEPETVLAPDAAFVRADRAPDPKSAEYDEFWRLAPDLVVEVAPPSQYSPEMAEKARAWLRAGTLLVWVVWPKAEQVDVWQPEQGPTTLQQGAWLDGAAVLPGFRLALADLFVA